MTITIRDIARKLNLSIAAVSRALNGYPDISPETRRRVELAAQEMGYVPNRAARQLRSKHSDTLGFILPVAGPRFADPFYSEFIEGLSDETAAQSFDLLITTAAPGTDAEQAAYRSWVLGNKVDGMVINRVRRMDWRVQFLAQNQFPFSGLELSQDGLSYPHVTTTSRQAFHGLVQHLAQAGFTRLAFIGGPPDSIIQHERQSGFVSGVAQAGLDLRPEWLTAADFTSEGGYRAALGLLDLPQAPDALVCITDETAFGALRAAQERQRVIGRQVAVTGFDGVHEARYTNPPLTTLDVPVYEMARTLVRLLCGRVRNEALILERIIFTPRLLARTSSLGRMVNLPKDEEEVV